MVTDSGTIDDKSFKEAGKVYKDTKKKGNYRSSISKANDVQETDYINAIDTLERQVTR